MHYSSTIFNQLLAFMPKTRFQQFVGQHDGDRYVKKLTTWNQLVALLYAQATGKDSLREIETGLKTQSELWYHLGIGSIARSSLSDANGRRNYRIFESLFYALMERCREITPHRPFTFSNPLYSLDATTIKLCLSLFDWAHYTKTKGALKLHTLLDVRTAIPSCITITDGKSGDVTIGKQLDLGQLERGSIIVFDRAYIDFRWWYRIERAGMTFVSRAKSNQAFALLGTHAPIAGTILADDRVLVGEFSGMEKYPEELRRVCALDRETGTTYTYVTNNFTLSAEQIVEIYRSRWHVELFFKWIKQNLKIKTFLGTSPNAVLSQVWVAMIYYLLLAYIKFQTKFSRSLLELTRMIRETLLLRRPLIDLLSLSVSSVAKMQESPPQLVLF